VVESWVHPCQMSGETTIHEWRSQLKHYKTVFEEHQRLEFVTCDCCGKPWSTGRLEVNEVEIFHREGTTCEGDSWGQALYLDICPACFKTKKLFALRAIGITREYERYG
jgi:hypothetical protein